MVHLTCMGQMRDVCRMLVGKSEGHRPLKRSKHICEHNIKMDCKNTECENTNWIHLLHNRVQSCEYDYILVHKRSEI
jgi:hypothetical protein